MQIKELSHNDLGPLSEALKQAGLPADDVEQPDRRFFSFSQQGVALAFGGIEGEEADRLLRSLVVIADQRGRGIGAQVLGALEAFAKNEGVTRLHLLTEGAAAFFATQGYQVADRTLAPVSISATAQFESLCPASATYLSKGLA